MNLFLQGGEVATENEAPQRADVWILDGVIKNVGVIDVPEGARVIDCAGKIVMPGMFDAHVHFREPGQEKKGNDFRWHRGGHQWGNYWGGYDAEYFAVC